MMKSTPIVQLGFSQPREKASFLGHESPKWKGWDGGKNGGKPSFLNPRDVPQAPLRCRQCMTRDGTDKGTILRFISQLYSPADEDTGNAYAYHRTLYLFACPHPKCSSPIISSKEQDTNLHVSNSVVVLRCQMPKINDFYPPDGKDDKSWNKHTSEYWKVNLCIVCGQRASGKCPKMNKWFCCKEHQIEYYKINKVSAVDTAFLESVYEESELVVEDEPEEESMTEEELRKVFEESMFVNDDKDQDKLDAWSQKDLNEITGIGGRGVTDTNTIEFYTRIGRAQGDVKGQCLRYCRWPVPVMKPQQDTDDDWIESTAGPLWISSLYCPSTKDIPCCEYCGSERRFEFQIMPQMLHFLSDNIHRKKPIMNDSSALKDAMLAASNIIDKATDEGLELDIPDEIQQAHEDLREKMKQDIIEPKDEKFQDTLDWGVVCVYTCIKSCGGNEIGSDSKLAYKQEFAWRQPPLRYDE